MGFISDAITVWNQNWIVLLIAWAAISILVGVYIGLWKRYEGKDNYQTQIFTLAIFGTLALLLLFPIISGRQSGNANSNTIRMSAGRPAATLLLLITLFVITFNYQNRGEYLHYTLGGKALIIGLIILLLRRVRVTRATQSVQVG